MSERLLRRNDSLLREFRSLSAVGGEFGPVKTGPRQLPAALGIGRSFLLRTVSLRQSLLKVRNRGIRRARGQRSNAKPTTQEGYEHPLEGLGIMRCTRHITTYTPPPVKLNRKAVVALLLVGLASLVAGCSGINASQSVSPASFLIPGLLKAEPQPADPDATLPKESSEILIVQAR